ncbi:MAG: FRG domain-containing protein [Candidatus Poribacteria bacterium]|nr:FRG domain-containing protein [Candidatus Poribacteria bacterium]
MNNRDGQILTPSVAQELIVELSAGETVQKQEIVRKVGEAHTGRGGQLPITGADRPVTHALSKMKQSGLAENPERGVWVIKPARIKTLAEFMKWAKKFTPGDYVFRGIRNETHPIRASAYRRLKNDRNFERFLQINKDLIDETILRGYDERNGRPLSHLEMLAELQHHGAATCLIDFTYSAQIALWFACGQDSETSQDCDSKTSKDCENPPNGKVFAVYNQLPDFEKVKSNMLKNDIVFFLQDEETSPLYYWQPRQQNNRIIAQQSIFLFGRPEFEADAECVILGNAKDNIQTELKQVSGITEAMLFPDFEKFASLRGVDEPYTGRSADEYRELARERFNADKYDEAIAYYDRAIDQDPDYAETYYERAQAKHYQEQYASAISDFDKFISLNPNYVEAYYYRAEAKFGLGNLDGVREDLEIALPLAEQSEDLRLIGYIEGLLNDLSEITTEGEQDE